MSLMLCIRCVSISFDNIRNRIEFYRWDWVYETSYSKPRISHPNYSVCVFHIVNPKIGIVARLIGPQMSLVRCTVAIGL